MTPSASPTTAPMVSPAALPSERSSDAENKAEEGNANVVSAKAHHYTSAMSKPRVRLTAKVKAAG